jgi:hypothetical protein
MASHWSFRHLQPKLWAKERSGVKLAIWFPTTKSRESTCSRRALQECDMALKSSLWRLQVWVQTSSRSEVGVRSYEVPKSRESKLGQFRDSTLGVPGKRAIRMPLPWVNAEYTIGSMVVASLESGPWGVMWVRVNPWLVPTPNACRMSFNQLVLVLDTGLWPNSLISS